MKVDTLDNLCEIPFTIFGLFGTISISSEDDDVTVTPLIVTDVGAPISNMGTEGAETGEGPDDTEPLLPRAPTVASLVICVPHVLLDVNSRFCFLILGGGFGAGGFFPPKLFVLLCCAPSVDMTEESGAVTRLYDFEMGSEIFPEIFLTGRATEGLILLT